MNCLLLTSPDNFKTKPIIFYNPSEGLFRAKEAEKDEPDYSSPLSSRIKVLAREQKEVVSFTHLPITRILLPCKRCKGTW
jgi:hypothetical protein